MGFKNSLLYFNKSFAGLPDHEQSSTFHEIENFMNF